MSNDLSKAKVEVILEDGSRRRVGISEMLEAAGFVRAVEGDAPASAPARKTAAKAAAPATTETIKKD